MALMNTVTGKPIHSRLGPSSAHRWMNCTGSVRVIAANGLTEEEASEYAAKGSVCHTVAAECLMNGKEAWEFCGRHYKQDGFDFEFDEEMVVWVDEAIQAVRQEMKKWEHLGAILYVETQVSSEFDPEAYGTADIRIEVPGHFLIVMDFKFGWIRVQPSDEQLKLYGTYAYEMRGTRMTGKGEPKEIRLCILQPRLPNPADHIRWNKDPITPQQLEEWFFGEVLIKMAETRDPNAPLTMGDHCKFCPANTSGKCPAMFKEATTLNIGVPLDTISNEDLNDLANKVKLLENFLKGVMFDLTNRAKMGHKFKDWKLVEKMGDRLWHVEIETDDLDAEGKKIKRLVRDILRDQYAEKAFSDPELKSPAQIEKLPGGKKLTARFAYKPSTGQTIAPTQDNREPVVGLMERLDRQNAANAEVVY